MSVLDITPYVLRSAAVSRSSWSMRASSLFLFGIANLLQTANFCLIDFCQGLVLQGCPDNFFRFHDVVRKIGARRTLLPAKQKENRRNMLLCHENSCSTTFPHTRNCNSLFAHAA